MPGSEPNRRRGLATATIGAAGLAAGGKLNNVAATRVIRTLEKEPRVHGLAILRHGDKRAKQLYAGGNALAGVSAVPFAVGAHELFRRKETAAKRDKRDSFLQEGVRGTADAVRQKADSVRTPVPLRIRATQTALGLGAGAGGSALARRALRRVPGAKPLLGPIAGAAAGLATLPLSNAVVRRQSRGEYVSTPAGVRRAKKAPVRASSKSYTHQSPKRSLQADVGKGLGFAGVGAQWTSTLGRVADATAPKVSLNKTPSRLYRAKRGLKGLAATKLRETGTDASKPLQPLLELSKGWKQVPTAWGARAHPDKIQAVKQGLAKDPNHKMVGHGRPMYRVQNYARHGQIEVGKRGYLGSDTPYATQRASITSQGAVPGVGPLLQARQAARYAPPKQKAKAATRQLAFGPVAGLAAGFGAAHAGAALAGKSKKVEGFATDKVATAQAHPVMRHFVKTPDVAGATGRKARAFAHPLVEPLVRSPGRTAAAVGAGLIARGLVTGVGNQRAITANQADQSAYNNRHHIKKFDVGNGQTKRDAHKLANRKRLNAALSTTGGLTGLTALGLLAAKKPKAATQTSIVGSGIGGLNALVGAKVQRKEAKVIDPVKKAANIAKAKPLPFLHPAAPHFSTTNAMASYKQISPTHTGALNYIRSAPFGPSAPEKVKRALSGNDFGETVSRLGRATRRQRKEFSTAVHPISGRILDMRSGDAHSASLGGIGVRANRRSAERMAHLADNAKNPAVRSRALANLNGENKRIMGPDPVFLHNHPPMDAGTVHRAAPSATDTGALRALGNHRLGVISHAPGPRGQKQTKLVMTRNYASDKADIPMAERRFANQDRATAPKSILRDAFPHYDSPDAAGYRKERRKALKVAARTKEGRITDYTSYFRAKTGSRKAAEQTGLYSRTTMHKSMPELPWTGTRKGYHPAHGKLHILAYHGNDRFTVLTSKDERRIMHRNQIQFRKDLVGKRDEWKQREPLKTSVSEDDARRLVARHGLKGPLPKTLDREQRRSAYEARYVTAGGKKAEHWQHRAVVADKVKTGGLAGATAGGAVWLGTRGKHGPALVNRMGRKVGLHHLPDRHRVQHASETAAAAAATIGGGGELYAGHARRKRSSYSSAPAGVAASALRRMQDYDRS